MVENGRKKEVRYSMERGGMKVNIDLRILPFGQVSFQIKLISGIIREEERKPSFYAIPKTTSLGSFEIIFAQKEGYKAPETTGVM
jgi:hypothetical protein